ncbi:hypothetical protein BV898_04592 [Hypsibius exemplaris]|uniref:Uncharacterized protein n=1 Tax=Hypsibius exemplaris TaxID=2072580 RepID=A0A1W0X1P9_HYPEX|nr:hypothetical protein BV898_04592 [Hypsibius exemplaris]
MTPRGVGRGCRSKCYCCLRVVVPRTSIDVLRYCRLNGRLGRLLGGICRGDAGGSEVDFLSGRVIDVDYPQVLLAKIA